MLLEVGRRDVVGIPYLLIRPVAVGRKVNRLHAANVTVQRLHDHKVGLVGPNALHVGPFGAEQIAEIGGRESDVGLGCILTCHLHQAGCHAHGVVGQAGAVGVDGVDERELNRWVSTAALGVAPEIRLKVHQGWLSVGLQLGEQQAHVVPVLLHEGVVVQYRQVALSVRCHLSKREHGHSAHTVRRGSYRLHIGAIGRVPCSPGIGAHAVQVLVVDVGCQGLLRHIGGRDGAQPHQKATWLAEGRGQRQPALIKCRWRRRRRGRTPAALFQRRRVEGLHVVIGVGGDQRIGTHAFSTAATAARCCNTNAKPQRQSTCRT